MCRLQRIEKRGDFGKELNLGTIALETESIGLGDVTVTASVAVSRKTPVAVAVIDPVAIENKLSTQEFPEILKSTPSIYATKQGGGFGDSRVNVRGFESENVAVMVNGVPMNEMESGKNLLVELGRTFGCYPFDAGTTRTRCG